MSDSIDWSATGDMLSGIGTIGGAAAVLLAAFLGRNALKDFTAQRQIERQLHHAEAILTSAYQLQAALDDIRSPLSTAYELSESEKELDARNALSGLTEEQKQRFVQANVFYVRSAYFNDEFSAGQKLIPFAAAFFGEEVKVALNTLIRNRHRVRVYADAYARGVGNDSMFARKVEAAIWKGAALEPEEDEITNSTDDAVAVLEKHLFPLLGRNAEKGAS